MRAVLLSFLFSLATNCFSQEYDIPLGAWRLHLNYSNSKSLAEAGGRVYSAADYGVMYVDIQEHSTGSISKLNGLSGIGVNCLANDVLRKTLLIGYHDGTFDFLEDNKIVNLK